MSTLAQTASGDIDVSSGTTTLVTDSAQAAAAILSNKFRRFQSEWFADTREGIPYFDVVFVKSPDLGVIRQMFREVILGTPPIVAVEEMTLSFDKPTRVLQFGFRARTDEGVIITGGSGEPFIVEES